MDKKSIKPLEELLDSVRDIDGFPIGEDEDILALSDPPFYTACPNPYIEEFIKEYGTPYDPENDNYYKKPFTGDITEGKNDEIYRAHKYHTKVPYKAIMQFIKHYTDQGDLIFDGFCGSGMSGVAAGILKRKIILSDLSPAATFITYNYTVPTNPESYKNRALNILKEIEKECDWMFKTNHVEGSINIKTKNIVKLISKNDVKGDINYVVWSDVLICPYCKSEYSFWDAAVIKENGKIKKEYNCPDCNAKLAKKDSKPVKEELYDSALKKTVYIVKQIPVMITYTIGNDRYRKRPDKKDLEILKEINNLEIPYWFPKDELPDGVKINEPKRSHGLTNIHQFYTKRNLWILAAFADKIGSSKNYINITSVASINNKLYRFRSQKGIIGAGGGPLNGTYYIPPLIKEIPMLKVLKEHILKAYKLKKFILKSETPIIQTCSTTNLECMKDNSIDYIITDPPFGDHVMFSELNFIWECWLKVFTKIESETVINKKQDKGIIEYTKLMTECFNEMHRVLKPKRWITIIFHNSSASVWNSIQESISRAGFIIVQVSLLDRKHGSFNQVTTSGSVKNDLIINAYKPNEKFTEKFISNSGENMEFEFIAEHLKMLPVSSSVGRTEKMLYSRMLAHYVENGFKIRYNSQNFFKFLSDNLTELDGYWFLDSQINEYNEWKSGLNLDQLKEVLGSQQILIVSDEKSALTWIYNFLNEPKDFSELYTAYQQVTTTSSDEIPELREILDNNFIIENGKYRRPLNQQEKEEINKNREKELGRAFEKLLNQAKTQKGKIKNIRREAMVHGFTKCYQEGRYQDILTIADKLYSSTLESSGEIMDFIDIARIKTSGEG